LNLRLAAKFHSIPLVLLGEPHLLSSEFPSAAPYGAAVCKVALVIAKQ